MIDAAPAKPAPDTLVARYSPDDLRAFDAAERMRFVDRFAGEPWERTAPYIAWEILYRKEPGLYERLIAGERIHPRVLEAIPGAARAVEVAAGTGRLTLDIAGRFEHLITVEPVEAFRGLLESKLRDRGIGNVDVSRGFFDELPIGDGWADVVVSCSAFTPSPMHGGEDGLRELERVAAPGGWIGLVWPGEVEWLRAHGFTYESFEGDMSVDFVSAGEAVELARIFYPHAADEIARLGSARVSYEVLEMNPPRDIAWKVVG